ncbi:MAG: 6-carboxytetrahydropterin synthase [Bacteroidetes bacterium]|nr:6-carboxytetrahydropterin synthase [Bacteroidales bacterium]MBU1009070.1 6-carboxytetrahydropterin synthase [Bacteroidota bacterium]
MVFITRRERFNAAHRLFRTDFSDEKNAAVFGKCSNPNWHGHNYELFVTVKGEINPETGFLINLKLLGSLIRETIIEQIDHKNINLEVPFMAGKFASTEVLSVAIWDELYAPIQQLGAELHCVKLFESENNFVEYYG